MGLQETGFFVPVEHPSEGPIVTMAIPPSFSKTPGSLRLGAPRLGEHTEPILAELGYDSSEIAAICGR